MISHFRNSDNGEFLMTGLSTDEKPTEDVPNGAIFVEMDTSQTYRFDKSTGNYLQSVGGGGNIVIHGKQLITENGTYDVWDKDEVEVNVSGGGMAAFFESPYGEPFSITDESARYIHPECFCFYSDDAIYGGYEGLLVTEANFPSLEAIGYYGFYACSLLSSVSFPRLQLIGNNAFAGCSALSTISLPSIEMIEENAFMDCASLASVYLLGSTVCSVGGFPFSGTPIADGLGAFYVPASMYDAYIEDPFWGMASDFIHIYDGAENAGGEP